MVKAESFFAIAREREAIRRRRCVEHLSAPWTDDPIFREWRFCNVHREHDKTTEWFRDNVRSKLTGLAVVEATIAFRWFNRIETGEVLLDLLLNGWNHDEALRRLLELEQVFSGAYRISHHSRGRLFTGAYIVKSPDGKSKLRGILECIEEARRKVPEMLPQWGELLCGAWNDLRTIPFLGPFMAYEVVSDLRWTDVLHGAEDVCLWANPGPGCARGLGQVLADEPRMFNRGSNKHRDEMFSLMYQLLEMSRQPEVWPYVDAPWEMREVEHWACEADKYWRAERGERLKRRFAIGRPQAPKPAASEQGMLL